MTALTPGVCGGGKYSLICFCVVDEMGRVEVQVNGEERFLARDEL